MFNQHEDILTVLEVAEILYIGRNTVYDLLHTGKLKGVKIGRSWKIPKASLEKYIKSSVGLN